MVKAIQVAGLVLRRAAGAAYLGMLVLAAPLSAAPAADPNGVAVVVGNRHYEDGVPEVLYAHRDAAAFREYLVGVRGFDPDNIIELTDATQGEMTRTFGSASSHEGQLYYFLPDRLGGTSEVVVFYSGHGVPGTDGEAYLATADADLGTAHLTAYPLAQLYTNLGKLPAKSVTVYLDACFSGGSQGGALPTSASPIYRAAALPTGVAQEMTVLAAASDNELASWDEQAGHGMFTHHLLDALYGAGDNDGDGEVTAREAKRYLDQHLTRAVGRAYMRPQTASLVGEAGAVLAFAPRGGFPRRPTLEGVDLGPDTQPFTVLAEPAGARVRILNIEERYRPGLDLPPGEYRIEVSQEGYETAVHTVRHGAEGVTEHRVVLQRSVRRLTPGERFRDCPDCPQMVVIPAGRFRMGCVSGQDCYDGEMPVHDVRIGAPFALAAHETTFAEWDACVAGGGCGGYRPSDQGWGRDGRPVINVSWDDAQSYVTWLSRTTGESYRLPSEAEWEYAARAGSRTKYHFGNAESVLCRYANHADASTEYDSRNTSCSDGFGTMTAPAGSFEANAFGLYDMHGNVWEWVEDCWNDGYAGAPGDGRAWQSGDCTRRVLRGGSWFNPPRILRAADRNWLPTGVRNFNHGFGFRVARTLTP